MTLGIIDHIFVFPVVDLLIGILHGAEELTSVKGENLLCLVVGVAFGVFPLPALLFPVPFVRSFFGLEMIPNTKGIAVSCLSICSTKHTVGDRELKSILILFRASSSVRPEFGTQFGLAAVTLTLDGFATEFLHNVRAERMIKLNAVDGW